MTAVKARMEWQWYCLRPARCTPPPFHGCELKLSVAASLHTFARMFRTALVTAVLIAASGCNVCTRLYNAEQMANEKGKDCGSSNNLPDPNICTNGLSSCSPDDVNWLNTYADCIEKLPYCQSGQSFSWGLQRFGCIESLAKVSGSCRAAIQ
jgi:hypothetical protein